MKEDLFLTFRTESKGCVRSFLLSSGLLTSLTWTSMVHIFSLPQSLTVSQEKLLEQALAFTVVPSWLLMLLKMHSGKEQSHKSFIQIKEVNMIASKLDFFFLHIESSGEEKAERCGAICATEPVEKHCHATTASASKAYELRPDDVQSARLRFISASPCPLISSQMLMLGLLVNLIERNYLFR